MKIKTSELIGPALDWAVAQCEIIREDCRDRGFLVHMIGYGMRMPPYSTDWAQGGPIIEREFIEIRNQTSFSGGWEAWKWIEEAQNYLIIGKQGSYCNSPLIAAMRCHVASKLGNEVEVPEELMGRL